MPLYVLRKLGLGEVTILTLTKDELPNNFLIVHNNVSFVDTSKRQVINELKTILQA